MTCSQSPCSDDIKKLAAKIGFDACGITTATPVDSNAVEMRRQWIAAGMHAGMEYLTRYDDLRCDPGFLMPRCKSVIMLAASYHSDISSDIIARYALGDDYHDVLRKKAQPIVSFLQENNYAARICIDTAPLAERYWAVKAGIGFIGLNSMLIIPGIGSRVFLASILTDLQLNPDTPVTMSCIGCGRCISECPGHAIMPDKTVDARRCLSYITIEHRGDFSPETDLHGRLYGCDRCQDVCPHNTDCAPFKFDEFSPRPDVVGLTVEEAAVMTQQQFSTIFKGSAIKRAKLAGLTRNARRLLGD